MYVLYIVLPDSMYVLYPVLPDSGYDFHSEILFQRKCLWDFPRCGLKSTTVMLHPLFQRKCLLNSPGSTVAWTPEDTSGFDAELSKGYSYEWDLDSCFFIILLLCGISSFSLILPTVFSMLHPLFQRMCLFGCVFAHKHVFFGCVFVHKHVSVPQVACCILCFSASASRTFSSEEIISSLTCCILCFSASVFSGVFSDQSAY